MTLLVTGAAGQLGRDLLALAPEAVGTDVDSLDLTDGPAVRAYFAAVRPTVVIHGAAFTAVDAAESQEELAHRVNAVASGHVAAAAAAVGAGVIAVSTDYVFPGDATRPYEVADEVGPRSAYGRTKLAGEVAVRTLLPDASWVVRTAWVWGAGGSNFVKTMAALAQTRDTVSVVDDQVGSPTWSRDLATGLLSLAERAAAAAGPGAGQGAGPGAGPGAESVPPGIYHLTGGGSTSWFGFARAIFDELGLDPERVLPTTTDAFPRPAPRPAYSVLSTAAWERAGLAPLRDWRAALSAAFADPEVAAALRG